LCNWEGAVLEESFEKGADELPITHQPLEQGLGIE
jgi:hypothetical protein